MISPAHQQKLSRRFDLMDANGNGYLERDDYEALARRLVHGFAEPPESPKGKAVIDSYLAFWEGFILPMDGDGDGRVSRAEFVACVVQAVADGDGFDRVYRPHIEAVLNLADTDGDGVLSRSEFVRFMRLYGVSAPEAEAAFPRLDLDGDGSLTVDELAAAARDYYLSDDLTSTGSALFGRV